MYGFIIFFYSDDFEEIKQDISSFRYEMLNAIKANELQVNEMTSSVSSILDYVKSLAHEHTLETEDEYPKENDEEDTKEESPQNFDNAIPDTNPTLM